MRQTSVVLLNDTSHKPETSSSIGAPTPTCPHDRPLLLVRRRERRRVRRHDPRPIPANTLAVAQTTVDKIVTYQTQLPAPPGDDSYSHATVAANFQGLGPQDARGSRSRPSRMRAGCAPAAMVTRLNTALSTAEHPALRDGATIPEELRRPAQPWTDGRDQVVSKLDAGPSCRAPRPSGRPGWAGPGVNVSDVEQVQLEQHRAAGGDRRQLQQRGFQFQGSPSFDRQLLQRQGGGAVLSIGGTDVRPTVQSDQLMVGSDAIPATRPTFGSLSR